MRFYLVVLLCAELASTSAREPLRMHCINSYTGGGSIFVDCSRSFRGGFKSIPKDIFASNKVKTIRLGNNPYDCKCSRMKWFVEKIQNKVFNKMIADASNVKCAKPKWLAGRKIMRMKKKDICPDKCAQKSHTCHANAKCKDRNDGYDCICNKGYRGNGKTCTDINECLGYKICSKYCKCQNTKGSYKCTCSKSISWERVCKKTSVSDEFSVSCVGENLKEPPGDIFTIPTKYSIFLKENPYICDCDLLWFVKNLQNHPLKDKMWDLRQAYCAKPKHMTSYTLFDLTPQIICPEDFPCLKKPCNQTEKCIPKKKSYICEDLDECLEGQHSCHKNATCTNTIGGYECSCTPEFEDATGNGTVCIKKTGCGLDPAICPKNAICIKYKKKYRCRCKTGFKIESGKFCVKPKKFIKEKDEEEKKEGSFVAVIIGATAAGICSIIGAVVLIMFFRKRNQTNETDENLESEEEHYYTTIKSFIIPDKTYDKRTYDEEAENDSS